MKIEQACWTTSGGWQPSPPGALAGDAQLVFAFGSTDILSDPARARELRAAYPNARILGCSTAGEIEGTRVYERSLVTTAVRFAHTTLKIVSEDVDGPASSRACGERLASALNAKDLVHMFVLSDGLRVNGSALVEGLRRRAPAGVQVTGGLSGDGERFQQTLVLLDEAAKPHRVVALGLYGTRLKVGYGSLGGWDPFGPEREVTRSAGNVLYELDGQPALDLYKRYLGEHAAGLPATGLLFPLSIRADGAEREVVRTILSVNEAERSMTFAGDLPQGARAQLMKANFDRLIDGAHGAAKASHLAPTDSHPELAILISCVGRKLVLKQRVEEELEAVRDVFGERTALTGFYSYGEICPAAPKANCELHNQTMTITTLLEC